MKTEKHEDSIIVNVKKKENVQEKTLNIIFEESENVDNE